MIDNNVILLTIIIVLGSIVLLTDTIIDLIKHNKKLDEAIVDEMFKHILASFCTEHDCNVDSLSITHAPMGRNVICSTIAFSDIVMRIYFYKRKIVITYKNFTFFQYNDRKVFKMKHGIFYLQDIENTIHKWSLEMFGEKPLAELTKNAVIAARKALQEKNTNPTDLLFKTWDNLLEKAADSGIKSDLKNLMSLTTYIIANEKENFIEYIKDLSEESLD